VKAFLKVMRALSDPNRVKIIKMLQHKVMCVCEMRAALQIAQPSVSKHLKILEDAGLVIFHKDGMWVNYQLADGSATHRTVSVYRVLQMRGGGYADVLPVLQVPDNKAAAVPCERLQFYFMNNKACE